MKVEPVILEGQHVRLVPLTLEHAEQLLEAGKHEDIWRFLPMPQPRNLTEMEQFIQTALDQQTLGNRLPFAAFLAFSFTGAAVFGLLSFICIERPFIRLKKNVDKLGTTLYTNYINKRTARAS